MESIFWQMEDSYREAEALAAIQVAELGREDSERRREEDKAAFLLPLDGDG